MGTSGEVGRVVAAGGATEDFAELIAELAAFRNDRLQRRPSDRTLAKAAADKVATASQWLPT